MAGAVLSAEEREEIRVGCAGGESFALMARTLGRSTSTVSEEVRRNGGRHRYCAVAAGRRAVKQRCRPKSTKFQSNRALADHVEDKLAALDSPTTIAIELARAGGISGDTVSAESIYQAVYGHGTRGLAGRVTTPLKTTNADSTTPMPKSPTWNACFSCGTIPGPRSGREHPPGRRRRGPTSAMLIWGPGPWSEPVRSREDHHGATFKHAFTIRPRLGSPHHRHR